MLLSPASSSENLRSGSDFWAKFRSKKQETHGSDWQPRPSFASKQRFLTLSSGEIETIRILPNTFAELEAVVRDWIKPSPNVLLSLRVPVEYASISAARLISGPYLYLTGEESFQITVSGLHGLRVEVVRDNTSSSERSSLTSVAEGNAKTRIGDLGKMGAKTSAGDKGYQQLGAGDRGSLLELTQKKMESKAPDQSSRMALIRQRLLTLAFGEIETIHLLPNTFAELEAVAHDWIRPSPNVLLNLRVPVEYASFHAARLVSGPYVYLTNEDSFQIAVMGLNKLMVEIVSDMPLPPNESLSPSSPPVSEMDSNSSLELTPSQNIAVNVAINLDELDMTHTKENTVIDDTLPGKLDTAKDAILAVQHSTANKLSTAMYDHLFPDNVDAAESSFKSLCDWFAVVLADQSKYRTLLTFRTDTAQKILDMIQMLLDDPRLEIPHLRKCLLSALVRLSRNAVLYPKCYTLRGIKRGSEAVASGHFGEIWQGEFEGHKVCLKMVKVFRKSQVEHLLKAFCKEAIVWKHLSHPNVLPFYGIYRLDDLHDRVCLVSPWMENGNVIDFLERNPEIVRLLLISDILEGISYLHDENIVHGDIKGVNVVVTESGRACLADFGLSSLIDADILRWTSVATTAHASGTVRWQAQELFDAQDGEIKPTKASDIYSFSCTCYEIFTGRVPYHEITRDSSVILKVMQGGRPSHPSPSMENSLYYERGMNDVMWFLMEACWHSDPTMRPTAKEALSRLPFRTATENEQRNSNILSSFEFRSTNHISDHISAADVEEIMSLI